MVIIEESILKDEEEIQQRINVFVTYVNQCLAENKRKKICDEEGRKMNEEERLLKLFDIMDDYNVDLDTAEIILTDEEEDDNV